MTLPRTPPRAPSGFGAAAAGLLVLGAVACGAGETPTRPGPPVDERMPVVLPDTVDLLQLADAWRDRMPGNGSNGYVPPTAFERGRFVDAVRRIGEGDLDAADALLDTLGYDALVAVEGETGDSLALLVERTPIRTAWGAFVRDLGDARPVDVHVNHPVHDLDTGLVGALLFRACDCRWLLMAGAHRYANPGEESDMARSTTSVFQAVWEAVAAGADVALSVHGFAAGNHDPPIRDADVVLSHGATSDGDLAATDAGTRLRDRLRAEGYRVGLVGADAGFHELSGSPNPQGRYASDTWGHDRWIQVELARPLRETAAERERIVAAIEGWIRERWGG